MLYKQMVDIGGIKKFVKVLASNSRLNVKFEENLKAPHTNGNTIVVGNPQSTWSKQRFVLWWGSLYHEISHNYPETRDAFTMAHEKKLNMDSFFGYGINLLEDYRIELFRNGEYCGRDNALDAHNCILVEQAVNNKAFGKAPEDKERRVIESMLCFDMLCRETWQHSLIGLGIDIYKMLDDEQKEWVDKLYDAEDRYQVKPPPHNTAFDVYDKWKLALDEVFEMDADEEEQKAQAQGEGENGDGEEGKGEGVGEGEDGEPTAGEGTKKVDSSKDARVKYSDILKHMHTSDEDNRANYSAVEIEYDVSDRAEDFKADDIKQIPYFSGNHEESHGHYTTQYAEGLDNIKHLGKGLSSTVRRLLQIRSKSKRVHGKKKGKINGKALYRMSIPNSGSYGEKVFSQKTENDMLDTAVTVLGDMSGSMGGSKYLYMAHSCIMLNEAISPLKIPLEILGFTEERGKGLICIYKTFNSRTTADWLANDFATGSGYMGQNADGEAIQFAYHRLQAQKKKRKILIVLSDGQPASDRRGAHGHTRQVIQYIQEATNVEIYGIGICSNAVVDLYKDHRVIKRPDELEDALLDVIKTKVIRL